MIILTYEKLKTILGRTDGVQEWHDALVPALYQNGINTVERIASFISQCAHESGNFTILKENLNYSQQGLRKVFPKYFPDDNIAFRYARQPEWIGSRVYAGRMGNGSEATKEGYKYRGRGILQITGKNNYRDCSLFLFKDERLLDNPDHLMTKEGAVNSACWFWTVNKINAAADTKDVMRVTKIINGGTIGLAHRTELYNTALKVLQS